MTNLLDSGLAALRVALDAGAVSPVELCTEYLGRYERWEAHLNAFISISPDDVLSQARQAEREISAGDHRGALHGIPIAIKDNIQVREQRTTAGSMAYANAVSATDAVVVARLRAAGAIIFGKTNLPEVAYGPVDTYAYGPTYNPWDTTRFAGGSSMGSGAAVAAGVVPAALGTDSTGSIRNPASWSGLSGLKPTFGLVSVRGLVPLAPSLDHIGPLTKSAADCATVLECIAGHDARDPHSSMAPHDAGRYGREVLRPLPRLRVGVLTGLWEALPASIAEILSVALTTIESIGITLVDADLPSWGDAVAAADTIVEAEAATVHRQLLALHSDALQPQLAARLRQGATISAVDYVDAQARALTFRRELHELFESVDLLVLPARERSAPSISPTGARPPGEIGARFMAPFNLSGTPALVTPCGFDDENLPVGIQFAAPQWNENLILRLAHQQQSVTDWHLRSPPVKAADGAHLRGDGGGQTNRPGALPRPPQRVTPLREEK